MWNSTWQPYQHITCRESINILTLWKCIFLLCKLHLNSTHLYSPGLQNSRHSFYFPKNWHGGKRNSWFAKKSEDSCKGTTCSFHISFAACVAPLHPQDNFTRLKMNFPLSGHKEYHEESCMIIMRCEIPKCR